MAAKQIVKTQRSALTRAIASAASISQNAPEIEITQHLEYLSERVEALDKCTTHLFDYIELNTPRDDIENALQAEIDKMIEYQEKAGEIRSQLRARLRVRDSPAGSSSTDSGNAVNGNLNHSTVGENRSPPLPVPSGIRTHEFQPDVFDGTDYLKFPSWRSEFGAIIDSHPTLDDTAKFAILRRSLSGQASDLLEGLHCTSANYRSAIDLLDSTYGDPNLLLGLFVTRLYDLQTVSSPVSAHYADLITKFDANQKGIRQIVSELDGTVDLVSYFLAPSLLARVPDSVKMRWLDKYHSPEERFNIDSLVSFLKNDLRNRKTGALLKTTTASSNEKPRPTQQSNVPAQKNRRPPRATTSALVADHNPKLGSNCFGCDAKDHRIFACVTFRRSKPKEKRKLVNEKKVCPKCLVHTTYSECATKRFCSFCGSTEHHSWLCLEQPSNSSALLAPVEPPRPDESMLQIISVNLCSDGNEEVEVRALIDSGASTSWIKSSLARKLGLQTVQRTKTVVQSLTTSEKLDLARTEVTLKSKVSTRSLVFRPWIFPGKGWKLYQPIFPEVSDQISRLSKFEVYDRSFHDVDILIGSDVAPLVLTGKTVLGFPTAVETIFGWALWGPTSPPPSDEVCLLSSVPTRPEALWEMEELGIKDLPDIPPTAPLPRMVDQRYQINLPFLGDQKPSDNLVEAKKRQARNEERRDAETKKMYHDYMQTLLSDGVIEPAPSESSDGAYFLPHRGIKQKNKLRVVFDASAKSRNKLSLNDCLQTGDNLLLLIPDVLTRFRLKRFPCNGDLKAAFHQISIAPEDRKWLRFLHEGKIFQFTRLPFGVKPAPWLLLSTLHAHFKTLDPQLGNLLRDSFFADDLVCSQDTLEEKDALLTAAQESLAAVKMTLRVPETDKVLGVKWDKDSDALAIDLSHLSEEVPLTKRGLLADFAAVFDPIGFLAPYTLLAKQLFQTTWKLNLKWDEPLPPEIVQAWMHWRKSPPEISVPRWTGGSFNMPSELHTFGDASGLAMGVAVYLVIPSIAEVNLIAAKSRLLPLKNPPTVPRAELTATLLAARMASHLSEVIANVTRVIIWTDSTTSLQWVKNQASQGVFVDNRVAEIRRIMRILPNASLRHVPGELNPADIPSRGADSKTLDANTWLKGPNFLTQHESEWPTPSPNSHADIVTAPAWPLSLSKSLENSAEIPSDLSDSNSHAKNSEKPFVACVQTSEPEKTVSQRNVRNPDARSEEKPFSFKFTDRHDKAVNRMAWVLRFIRNTRFPSNQNKGSLSFDERENAKVNLFKLAQMEKWPLSPNRSEKFRQMKFLRPFSDEKNVVFMSNRTHEEPRVILPHDHEITRQYITWIHAKMLHAGVQATLAEARRHTWITKGTSCVKSAIHSCGPCRRFTALPFHPSEGKLSSFRTEMSPCFSKIGVDFTGPLYLNSGEKAWILLIVCTVTRALKLVLCDQPNASNVLSAIRSLLAAYVPFFSKVEVRSDNARAFVKCQKAALPLHWMTWEFIPAFSPHWGGFYERFCKLIKDSLKPAIHGLSLDFADLQNVLDELAASINMRPLTPVSSDPNDELPIRPIDFMVPRVRSERLDSENEISSPAQDCYQQLWAKFAKNYMPLLRQWRTAEGMRTEPRVGDVVIIKSPLPRAQWPLAKVVKLHPNPLGEVRSVTIQINGKTSRRETSQLYLIEPSLSCKLGENPSAGSQECNETTPNGQSPLPIKQLTRSGRLIARPSRFRP